MSVKVKIKHLFEGSHLPQYATEGSGAVDLSACLKKSISIDPGQTVVIPTGIIMELPAGHGLFITPRSGLAIKHDIIVLNTPGLVDSDYRGEIRVVLKNIGTEVFYINPDARIAQAFVLPLPRIEWEVVDQIGPTLRGEGGFGHTGL